MGKVCFCCGKPAKYKVYHYFLCKKCLALHVINNRRAVAYAKAQKGSWRQEVVAVVG